ncbi:MAG: NAD(P)/FAD-dependent oxidoreductase [Planctomycetaceae bacterium]|jgi:phytoene dehydrogenase-like protein|nr:NAD(P)/FAD-dependent oxidoreductase [Planctomycetaceae bacterium]
MNNSYDNNFYDVIVIGSGLAGMTAANILGRSGHRVLLLEQHFQFGGLAATFRRRNEIIFDVSLHGFPVGMIKSCRRYWNTEIADQIVQLPKIRFDNPQFSLETTFDREDFTRLLVEKFGITQEVVVRFFDKARSLSHYDDDQQTIRELFNEFFPERMDVVRLLMEPITYANGSTLDDPALTYGIVFSNFMSKGVYTFRGGTDALIDRMTAELKKNGVEIRKSSPVQRILVENGQVAGVVVQKKGEADSCIFRSKVVLSNTNLKGTIFDLVGQDYFSETFIETAKAVRLNNSSTQVYLALKPDYLIDENQCGDLLFSSTATEFSSEKLLNRQITSRTFSFYYPKTRPGTNRCYIVSSTNANFADWAGFSQEEYEKQKSRLIEQTLDHLEKYVPDVREHLDWTEAATPNTFKRYTGHWDGSSFGTKYEGLAVSRRLPQEIPGLFHSGSVGIIMSGWLGAVNYGVIAANDVDAFLLKR